MYYCILYCFVLLFGLLYYCTTLYCMLFSQMNLLCFLYPPAPLSKYKKWSIVQCFKTFTYCITSQNIMNAFTSPYILGAIITPNIMDAITSPYILGAIITPNIMDAITSPYIIDAITASNIIGAITAPCDSELPHVFRLLQTSTISTEFEHVWFVWC